MYTYGVYIYIYIYLFIYLFNRSAHSAGPKLKGCWVVVASCGSCWVVSKRPCYGWVLARIADERSCYTLR